MPSCDLKPLFAVLLVAIVIVYLFGITGRYPFRKEDVKRIIQFDADLDSESTHHRLTSDPHRVSFSVPRDWFVENCATTKAEDALRRIADEIHIDGLRTECAGEKTNPSGSHPSCVGLRKFGVFP
jgi:hypothetical protein